jgi:DNA-binding transcriptional LysR family regulator
VDLRQLRYFLTVAEERRFSSAARRLHVATPSLSQQVRALERDLRVTLFDRTPRGAELTAAGRVLAERARVILTEVDRAREDVQSAGLSSREQVTLRICTMAERVLDGPLRAVGTDIPGVEVVVTSSPGDDAVEAVRQARADAAVVWSRPQEHRDLDGIILGSVPFGVVLPQAHPLADRAAIPVAGLGRETVVMFPWSPFSGIWQPVLDHLAPGILGVAEHMDVLGAVDEVRHRAAAGSPAVRRPGSRVAPPRPPRRPPPRRLPRGSGRRPGGSRLATPTFPAGARGQSLRTALSLSACLPIPNPSMHRV